MSSLTVKAYLLIRGGADPEIRRFAVDQDVSTNYEYLRGKVTQMFPSLGNRAFKLFWKDSENDMIAFSSDDELTEALGFVNDGVFKIYIKDISGTSSDGPQPDGPDTVHIGVECDGCEVAPIRGYRYKCVVCPDYDLCGTCNNKGTHAEHEMMRIATPWNGGPPPMFAGAHFFGPPHPFGPHPGANGPPPPPPPYGSWGRGGPGLKPWRRMMRNWRRWMTGENTGEETATRNDDQDEKKDGKAEDKPKEGPSSDSSSDEDGAESPNTHEEYLRNVGHNVAAMLDPLGIDVEVDVEHGDGASQRCGGRGFGPWAWYGPRGGKGRFWGSGRCGTKSGGPTRGGRRCPRGPWAAPSTTTEIPKEKPSGDVEMETGEAMKPKVMEASSSSPPVEKPGSDKEWTIVDEPCEMSPPPPSVQTQEAATVGLYPEVPQPATPQPPSDPRIANALDHMRAMGFGDEGGWLTTLLEATGGDINKALDAIRANRAK